MDKADDLPVGIRVMAPVGEVLHRGVIAEFPADHPKVKTWYASSSPTGENRRTFHIHRLRNLPGQSCDSRMVLRVGFRALGQPPDGTAVARRSCSRR
jgi:hypothetical protein